MKKRLICVFAAIAETKFGLEKPVEIVQNITKNTELKLKMKIIKNLNYLENMIVHSIQRKCMKDLTVENVKELLQKKYNTY